MCILSFTVHGKMNDFQRLFFHEVLANVRTRLAWSHFAHFLSRLPLKSHVRTFTEQSEKRVFIIKSTVIIVLVNESCNACTSIGNFTSERGRGEDLG